MLNTKEAALTKHLNATVLTDPEADSYLGTLGYSVYLGYSEFAQFFADIARARVLDSGSGFGGLATECSLLNFPVEVVSLNPRLILPDFPLSNLVNIEPSLSKYAEPKLKQAQQIHNQSAVAAYAQFLPFNRSIFDRVFDCRGILMHAQRFEEIEAAFKEFWRVLIPGGKLITAPFMNDEQKGWALETFSSLRISFTPIVYPQHIKDQGMLGGFRCYKPE